MRRGAKRSRLAVDLDIYRARLKGRILRSQFQCNRPVPRLFVPALWLMVGAPNDPLQTMRSDSSGMVEVFAQIQHRVAGAFCPRLRGHRTLRLWANHDREMTW